jgi:hypothetical protein
MNRYLDAQIVPVVIALDGRVGLTLWAPPREGDDGDEVEAFLGNETQVFAFASARELAAHLANHPAGDLAGHPAWPLVRRRQASDLRAEPTNLVDFDDMFRLLADEPNDPVWTSASRIVQLAEAIAAACDDTGLLDVLDRGPYQQVLLSGGQLHGRDARRSWQQLGQEASASWEWVIDQLAPHIRWFGDVRQVDLEDIRQPSAASTPWLAGQHLASGGGYPGYRGDTFAAAAELPSRLPTVLITLFFGVFGLIPAAVATHHANAQGVTTSRYWAAFGWTLLVALLVVVLLLVLIVVAAAAATS